MIRHLAPLNSVVHNISSTAVIITAIKSCTSTTENAVGLFHSFTTKLLAAPLSHQLIGTATTTTISRADRARLNLCANIWCATA
jgi:hypothetical protein